MMHLLLLWWLAWQRILQLLLLRMGLMRFLRMHAQVDAGMVGVGEIGLKGARVSNLVEK